MSEDMEQRMQSKFDQEDNRSLEDEYTDLKLQAEKLAEALKIYTDYDVDISVVPWDLYRKILRKSNNALKAYRDKYPKEKK